MSSRLAPIGKNRTISTQRYTFTFQPNSAEYNAQEVEAPGKISDISAPSGTKVFKAISASPFQQQVSQGDSVAEGDILQVELDAKPTAKETVEVVVNYSDFSSSVSLPQDLGGNGRFIYDICRNDQTVHVIDTNTDTDIKTISLPSGFDFQFGCYRVINKNVYIFDFSGDFIEIDADPASANFNNIVNQSNIGRGSLMDCYYNFDDDVIFFNRRDRAFIIFSPAQQTVKENPRTNGSNRSSSHYIHGVGIYSDNNNNTVFLDRSLSYIGYIDRVTTRGSEFFYKNNVLIKAQNGVFRVINVFRDSNNLRFQYLALLRTGKLRGGFCKDPLQNKAVMGQFDGNGNFEVLNVNSLTTQRFSSSSISGSSRANNFGAFSQNSGKVYVQRTNNQIVVFDLSKPAPFQSKITTGNHESYRFDLHRHALIANELRI